MNEILGRLCRNLDDEITERKALLGLIERQGSTIQSGNHEELGEVLSKIRKVLAVLTELESGRGELLERIHGIEGKTGTPTLSAIAAGAGEPHRTTLLEQRDKLRVILRDTLTRNRQNQYLVRFASSVINETMDMLTTGSGSSNKGYGPSGEKPASEQRGTLFRAQV